MSTAPGESRRGGDRRGFALPLVVLVLLALSLLATGLLLSSSTELVLSVAHRDAAEDLYAAEGAISAWTTERADTLAPGVVTGWTQPGGTRPMRIEVERLARLEPAGPGSGAISLFAVHAAALRGSGGRSVAALVRVREESLSAFDPDPDAALVIGTTGRIVGAAPGDVRVFDGSNHPWCTLPSSQSAHPAVYADEAQLQLLGGAQMEGNVRQSGLGRQAMVDSTLAGIAIRQLAWNAEVRFGRYFNEPPLAPGSVVTSGHADARYDWGCPADVVNAIRAAAPGSGAPAPCASVTDSLRYVVVGIDAENDTVVLTGNHGQGVLIVVNGGLHLTGSFVFKGLIVAEGPVVLSGARSNWLPSIEGAIVARTSFTIDGGLTPPGLGGGGVRAIRFNRCALQRAITAFNARNGGDWGAPRVLGRPHGWFEVVR